MKDDNKSSRYHMTNDPQVVVSCSCSISGPVLATNLLTSSYTHTMEQLLISTLAAATALSYDGQNLAFKCVVAFIID